MSREVQRDRIRQALADYPDETHNAIAKKLGVSNHWVTKVCGEEVGTDPTSCTHREAGGHASARVETLLAEDQEPELPVGRPRRGEEKPVPHRISNYRSADAIIARLRRTGRPAGPADDEILAGVLRYLQGQPDNGFCDIPMRALGDILAVVTAGVAQRACACGCGQPVASPRPEARYATGACRVRAHRETLAAR